MEKIGAERERAFESADRPDELADCGNRLMRGLGEISPQVACQRWRAGRASYRPLREPIDPSNFEVAPIDERAARAFVLAHHYSGSYPAAVARYGLFERVRLGRSALVGVAIFSVPIQPRAAAAYGAAGVTFCDLGRFVLLDHVGANAETFFLARARRYLAAEKIDERGRPIYGLVLSYSDPMPRMTVSGEVRHVGHIGQIYIASSALFCGRAKPRRLWLAQDASIVSERSLSKLRTGERGAAAAYQRLINLGAPRRLLGEDDRSYVQRALRDGPFRRLSHPGNWVFAFPEGSFSNRKSLRSRMRSGEALPQNTDAMIEPARYHDYMK
jgi:hypothetical protein